MQVGHHVLLKTFRLCQGQVNRAYRRHIGNAVRVDFPNQCFGFVIGGQAYGRSPAEIGIAHQKAQNMEQRNRYADAAPGVAPDVLVKRVRVKGHGFLGNLHCFGFGRGAGGEDDECCFIRF